MLLVRSFGALRISARLAGPWNLRAAGLASDSVRCLAGRRPGFSRELNLGEDAGTHRAPPAPQTASPNQPAVADDDGGAAVQQRVQPGPRRRNQAMLGHSAPNYRPRKSAAKRRREALTAGSYQIRKWKILRGDLVQVIDGRDKGMQGVVREVRRKQNRVIVEGVGMVSKCGRAALR